MKKRCLLCVVSVVYCLLAAVPICVVWGAGQYEIDSIKTTGNRTIAAGRVLSVVRSRVGQLFDERVAAEDAKRIAELAGVEYCYYNTKTVDDRIQLIFVVVERNLVRSIGFFGNRRYKGSKLEKKLDLRIGDYLDPALAEAGRKVLNDFYLKNGYAFASVVLDEGKLSYGALVYRIDEGPRVRIDSVQFRGNNSIRTRSLKNAVKSSEKKYLFWPRYYTKEVLEADLVKLQRIYQKKGFLDADITARRQFNEDSSEIRITFAIVEGAVYTVENIFLTGNEYFDVTKLAEMLRLQAGQVYNEARCKSDVKRLLKLYREVGFIDTRVEQKRKFVSKDKVDVEFAITQGERFRIGRINITGNEQTHDKVIRRVLDEYDFLPGQWYNADMARGDGRGELEKMVRQMALTESATITPTGELPGQRNAQVSVIEGQTGSIMLGGAVASDSGLIGQLVFDQRNFDITDWPDSFGEFVTGQAFKGAGQSLRMALQPGTIVSEYMVSFTEPYFMDKPTSLNVVGSSWERERESYNEERLKGYVGFEKRYKNRWRHNMSFRAENVDVTSIDAGAPTEITDVKGENALMGIRLGLGRDLTDNRFTPSSGDVFSASYEHVTGDHTFGILRGSYGRYTTLYEDLAERKTVLATRLLAATVLGGDAPPFEKFYAGGTGLYGMRGFDYRGVSTRGRNTITGKTDDPIGSDWIFLANAEVTVPLVGESLAGLIFVDSGTIDSGGLRAAAGVGVQIMIPQWFGPVPMRFEIAAPFMKDGDDEVRVFSFSVGRLF